MPAGAVPRTAAPQLNLYQIPRTLLTLSVFFLLCSIANCVALKLATSLNTVLFWPGSALAATLAIQWRRRTPIGQYAMLAAFTLLYFLSEYLAIMANFGQEAPPHCAIDCASDAIYVPLYTLFVYFSIRLKRVFGSSRRILLLIVPVLFAVITQGSLSDFITRGLLHNKETEFFITNWTSEQLATSLTVTMIVTGLFAKGWTLRLRTSDAAALMAIAALALLQAWMSTSQWLAITSIATVPCLIAITRLGYLWSILVSGCFIMFSSIAQALFYREAMPHLPPALFHAEVFSHRMSMAMVALLSIFMSDLVSQRNRLLRNALHQADTDRLTGLYNRNFVMRLIAQDSDPQPTGIVLVDIDHFKSINDTYGHHVGDRVIVAVATTIRQHLRQTDIAARWGGEEFLLILRDITRDQLSDLCQHLVAAVSSLSELDKDRPSVTISAGATHVPALTVQVFSQALSAADLRLYDAKHSGRNRAVC